MSLCPRCGLPLVTAGAHCPACQSAVDAVEAPLIQGALIAPPEPARATVCAEHGYAAVAHCVNCERPLCAACHYLLVNTAPWCLRCGQPFTRPDAWDRQATGRLALRVAVVLAGVILPFLVLPVLQEVAAVGLGVVLARWLLLGERAHAPKVLEVKPRSSSGST
jgi:hypothetical protein